MRVPIKTVILLSFIVGISACNTQPKSGLISAYPIFADSLYHFLNYRGLVEDTLNWDRLEKFTSVDSNTKKNILTDFYPFDSSAWSITQIFYYSKLHSVGNIQPIIVHINADDYGALVLVNFNSQLQVTDRFELSGGLCAGPDEMDSILIDCAIKHAVIIDSSHIDFYKLINRYVLLYSFPFDSLNNHDVYDSVPVIDSLSYKLQISENGKILSTLLDSIRIDNHKR